ncbi:MAG TPA: MlaD family protein [Xanthobacteraceae bacterium]|nr:MlaD family protein [Xanthobacteraceae bacterium]
METRANYTLIGAFTLAVLAAGFGFVMWFQSLHSTKLRTPLQIIFEGSASGLRNGASVTFNGIRIGEVTKVKIDNPRRVVVMAMVDQGAPIRSDTAVGLEFQGLTGIPAVALKGGSVDAAEVSVGEGGLPTLMADPHRGQDVMDAMRATLQNVNKLVDENRMALRNSIKNIEAFTQTLSKSSENIEVIVKNTGNVMAKADSVMGKIDGVMGKADGVMGKADDVMLGLSVLTGGKTGGELVPAVRSIRELAENFDRRSGALITEGRRTLLDISRAVNNFDRNPTRILFGPSQSTVQQPRR